MVRAMNTAAALTATAASTWTTGRLRTADSLADPGLAVPRRRIIGFVIDGQL